MPVSLTVSPMRDSRRAIVGASVIVRDRTERKRAEEAMREVQEAFRRAFEDAPIGMALFGVDRGRARPAAPGQPLALRDHRLRGARARGDDPRAGHPPATTSTPSSRCWSSLLSGEIPNYQLEKRFLRGDGKTVWVMYNASTVHDSAGRLLYGIAQVQDITAPQAAPRTGSRAWRPSSSAARPSSSARTPTCRSSRTSPRTTSPSRCAWSRATCSCWHAATADSSTPTRTSSSSSRSTA